VERLAREEGRRRFDLERGPLFRVTVIREGEEEHVLLLSLHHIISDGWSMGVLFGELEKLYGAYGSGGAGELEELPIQYADYAVWQREWLVGEVLEEQVKYWKEQLRGAPGLLELPTDRPRPPLQSYKGEVRNRAIGGEVLEAVKELSQKQGATLFMTLLAGLYVVLHRHSGAEDVVVGSPIANRNREETEGLIGFFVNTLALRVRVKGEESFAELLEGVKKAALGGYEHQDLPFEKLVEELQPERSLSYHPLFQVMFVLQNASEGTVRLPGLEVRGLRVEAEAAIFDLSLELREEKGELQARVLHNTDILEGETVERMLGHYERVLAEAARVPETKIRDLRLLDSTERQQIIVDWNRTSIPVDPNCTIVELFERHARFRPEAVALVQGTEELTYGELNRKANQLAHYLRRSGAGPEVPVAMCMERNFRMIVALLGILKAGSIYLPLASNYPKERLAYMIENAKPKVLLSEKGLALKLPQTNATIVWLDEAWPDIEQEVGKNPGYATDLQNAAYIIYTSGSSGRPKGVVVQHAGLANLIVAQGQTFEITATDRVLQFASVGFDASVFEIAMALATGASMVLASGEELLPGVEMTEMLRRHRITQVVLPPSALAHLPQTELPRLRQMIVAGEVCGKELVAKWGGKREFFNAYGPTETTVWATVQKCEVQDSNPDIGCPIANFQIYILDQDRNPVPINVRGEIYIGGAGLARGYLNRPDLTAERFVPDSFSGEAGQRLYRTGDLGRFRRNGEIEYLGRCDHQVKVRGYRIELGEIESVLKQHESVSEAIVVLDDSILEKRLIAYAAIKDCLSITAADLRSFLQSKLPEYMVPAALVLMDRLPITSNGKIDRKLLPLPDASPASDKKSYVPPATRMEHIVARIWQALLHIDRPGIQENFFEMGGHSLLLLQMRTMLEQELSRKISITELFRYPTIGSLAKHLHSADENASLNTSYERGEARIRAREATRRAPRARKMEAQ
jgi:amino acid adenylation domain-containing protein